MKKGMCVTLEDNKEYVLVDNVVYDGEKFFQLSLMMMMLQTWNFLKR